MRRFEFELCNAPEDGIVVNGVLLQFGKQGRELVIGGLDFLRNVLRSGYGYGHLVPERGQVGAHVIDFYLAVACAFELGDGRLGCPHLPCHLGLGKVCLCP